MQGLQSDIPSGGKGHSLQPSSVTSPPLRPLWEVGSEDKEGGDQNKGVGVIEPEKHIIFTVDEVNNEGLHFNFSSWNVFVVIGNC